MPAHTPSPKTCAFRIYIYIYAAPMPAHTPEKKQRNGIYIYICGAYVGAHPCVSDSFFAKTNTKPIKSLQNPTKSLQNIIFAKAPQQTQEIGSKKVLGAYPAHTPKCFPGHLAHPIDVDLDHFSSVL